MPRVPVISGERVQQSAATTPDLQVRAPQGAFDSVSAPINEVKSQIADEGIKAAFRVKRRADRLHVLEKINELMSFKNEQLWGDNGVLKSRGKDAFGIYDNSIKSYADKAREIEKQLSGQNQRDMFEEFLLRDQAGYDRTLQQHMAREHRRYADAQTASFIVNERNSALNNFENLDLVEDSITNQKLAVAEHGGLDPQTLERKHLELSSKTYLGVLSKQLASGQAEKARALYELKKQDLTPADQATVEKALKVGETVQTAQKATDRIMDRQLGLGDSLELARTIKNPETRDEVVRRVKTRYQELDAAKKHNQEKIFDAALNQVEANPGADPKDLISPVSWSQLSHSQRNALMKQSGNPKNDDSKWLNFFDMTDEELANLSKADFRSKFWAHFDTAHRNKAERLWLEARRETRDKSSYSDLTSMKEQVKIELLQAGEISNVTNMSKSDAKKVVKVMDYIDDEVARFEQTELGGKRKASAQERERVIENSIARKVYAKGGWFPHREYQPALMDQAGVVELKNKDTFIPMAQVSPAERMEIQSAAKDFGQNLSNEQIERAAAALRLRDNKRFIRIVSGSTQ